MKKIIYIFAALMTLGASSCSDMLEVDSAAQLSNQDINSKTDSVFYTFGIMSAMQQLADAYVLQNELRGDMVSTVNSVSDVNLVNLANFTAGTDNAYDSAYVYYRVINNVNYYQAHRDTTLKDGSTNVVTGEYAAMLTFRAWAYLQAVRAFGKVKYFTHPLTTISDIENDASPVIGREELIDRLIQDLEPFRGTPIPSYAQNSIDCGTAGGNSKTASVSKCFIPVDVLLADLYLERGDPASCMNAVQLYYNYITTKIITAPAKIAKPSDLNVSSIPQDFYMSQGFSTWSLSDFTDIISYIPMAVSNLYGNVSTLPNLFGYDYYNPDSSYIQDVQIVPSSVYETLASNSDFYYVSTLDNTKNMRKSFKYRDWRSCIGGAFDYKKDNGQYYISNYENSNIVLYYTSTVWLHLAEALNRAGYPDAAFAILKDGFKPDLINNYESYPYLKGNTLDMLSTWSWWYYSGDVIKYVLDDNVGIHGYGCGVEGVNGKYSPYQMAEYDIYTSSSTYKSTSILENKIKEIEEKYGISIERKTDNCDNVYINKSTDRAYDTECLSFINAYKLPDDRYIIKINSVEEGEGTVEDAEGNVYSIYNVEYVYISKEDAINAMEDILCDEYAMELPFMGCRFGDLMRMATHKNNSGIYGGNFGSRWLDTKIRDNNPNLGKSLLTEDNWYLPFN